MSSIALQTNSKAFTSEDIHIVHERNFHFVVWAFSFACFVFLNKNRVINNVYREVIMENKIAPHLEQHFRSNGTKVSHCYRLSDSLVTVWCLKKSTEFVFPKDKQTEAQSWKQISATFQIYRTIYNIQTLL